MLIEHYLYGIRVRCERALFDDIGESGGGAPGEHGPVLLQSGSVGLGRERYPVTEPLQIIHGREVFLHTDRPFTVDTAGQAWCLEIAGVVSFAWVGGAAVVNLEEGEEGSAELTAFWFIHVFLPLYLTLERGYDFIHCAAVEIDRRPVLFIAPSNGGKSTLADCFLQRGHPLLTDDKAGTFLHRGVFYAAPSHPHYRPFRQYEVLGRPVDNFASTARPIHAIYLLDAGDPDGPIDIAEVEGFKKFEALMPSYLYGFRFLRERRMRWLAQLADSVRVFKLRRPWSMDRQQEVYDAICAHSRGWV